MNLTFRLPHRQLTKLPRDHNTAGTGPPSATGFPRVNIAASFRRVHKSILFLFALTTTPALAAPAAKVDTIVRKVQARYDATADFTADVTQSATVASLGKTVSAKGTVEFKKPGKMRWELTDGDPQTIVADGKTLWLYRPDDQQVVRMPFDNAFHSRTPISFLSGVGRIADDFDAKLDGEADGEIRLLLAPKQPGADLKHLKLAVSADTYDLRAAEVEDPLGNTSSFRFSNLRRNLGIADSRFAFEVPAGVDVLDAPSVNK